MTSHFSPAPAFPPAAPLAAPDAATGLPSAARPFSFQIKTLPSYEAEARIGPKDGWAHEICQTGAE